LFDNQFYLYMICFAFVAVAVLVAIVAADYTQPTVWPQPKSFSKGNFKSRALPFKFTTKTTDKDVKTLTDAYKRTNDLIFTHKLDHDAGLVEGKFQKFLTTVEVTVADPSEEYPQMDTDESYTLIIPDLSQVNKKVESSKQEEAITLEAKTVYGAMMGLQTLSQLVIYDFEAAAYYVPSTPITIEDAPRYPHRGMLLDTSRHFQPIKELQLTIDALSWAKYNVLHWHVVDTQSFPFESKTNPRLWKGAYSNAERYSQADIRDLVEYGRARGVRIMIEFDMPGHAASWCAGYPEICPSERCQQPLNPASNQTFPLIETLLSECTGADVDASSSRSSSSNSAAVKVDKRRKETIQAQSAAQAAKALFPYTLLHLGGDEVSYTCWEQSAEIQTWESEQGLDGSEDTYEYFVDKVATLARDQARTPVQWVEVFEHFGANLDQNTVVHVWKEKSTMDGVLSAGYNALLSNQDSWYLDHLSTTWDVMYGNEPTADLSESSDPSLILGGESCMWAETVDASDLHNTVWPRAAAVAEVLWSPYDAIYSNTTTTTTVTATTTATTTAADLDHNSDSKANRKRAGDIDWDATEDRLETFRCLLTQRGVGAAPVTNLQARYEPKEPGSCYVQRRRRV